MKLKSGFVLKEMAGECIVVSVDAKLDLNGVITLNETAKTIWMRLEKGAEREELIKALLEEYDVDEDRASAAVDSFVNKIKELDFLE
jgi:hypothetical protein